MTTIVQQNKQLKEYAHELEQENKARDQERKKLEQEIQRLQNSRKSSTLYVPTTVCLQCQKYKVQILDLQKKIKHFQQTQHITIDKTAKTEWNSSYISSVEQDNLKLRQQNRALLEKIEFIENRVFILEDANRVLREEILNKMNKKDFSYTHANPTLSPKYHVIHENNFVSPLKVRMTDGEMTRRNDYMRGSLQEQRWETLQRKIKILEKENGQLKTKLWIK